MKLLMAAGRLNGQCLKLARTRAFDCDKAIILPEEDCEEFSNIQGLGQIRFPKGKVKACFEDVRAVLEERGITPAQ